MHVHVKPYVSSFDSCPATVRTYVRASVTAESQGVGCGTCNRQGSSPLWRRCSIPGDRAWSLRHGFRDRGSPTPCAVQICEQSRGCSQDQPVQLPPFAWPWLSASHLHRQGDRCGCRLLCGARLLLSDRDRAGRRPWSNPPASAPARNNQRAAINFASDYEFAGAVAQLEEHLDGIEGVVGSSPSSSIEDRFSRTTTVGSEEFGYRYARFLERAAAGESFLITRRGRPMARISPPDPSCAPATDPV